MASEVLSGASNPTYINNTTQNVRVVINYMYSNNDDRIEITWAGVSVGENGVEAIGKNIACGSGWYGDFFQLPWYWTGWWRRGVVGGNPRTAVSAQNVAIKLPDREVHVVEWTRGWRWWYRNVDKNIKEISGFSLSIALPLEIYLKPGQQFSAICGPYNLVVIKEDGD